jgi:hypothetical protein
VSEFQGLSNCRDRVTITNCFLEQRVTLSIPCLYPGCQWGIPPTSLTISLRSADRSDLTLLRLNRPQQLGVLLLRHSAALIHVNAAQQVDSDNKQNNEAQHRRPAAVEGGGRQRKQQRADDG